MHQHEQPTARAAAPEPRLTGQRLPPSTLHGAGNRALGRLLSRIETAEAVETLEKSLATGTLGAGRVVADTLAHYTHQASEFDKVNTDYEKKAKAPLLPAVQAVPAPEASRAQAAIPQGWYPGMAGESA